MKNKGILLDENYEAVINISHDVEGIITRGIVVADVTNQNQESIIRAGKGEIREDPLKGVGVINYIDDDGGDLVRAIRVELSNDGMNVKKIGFNNNNLILEANYE